MSPGRRRLQSAPTYMVNYPGRLTITCVSPAVTDTMWMVPVGGLILNVVESVIGTRTSGATVEDKELLGAAASALRP